MLKKVLDNVVENMHAIAAQMSTNCNQQYHLKGHAWNDPERRKKGADAVNLALEHEKAALSSLRKVLAQL